MKLALQDHDGEESLQFIPTIYSEVMLSQEGREEQAVESL